MLILSWTLFIVVAFFWTFGAWVSAEIVDWLASALASGNATQAARDIAALPLPQWVKDLIDPILLDALQKLLRWAMDLAGSSLPLALRVAGWIVVAIWLTWGAGMLVLAAAAFAAHYALRRFSRREAST